MHIRIESLCRQRFLVTGFVQSAVFSDQAGNFTDLLQNDLLRHGQVFLVQSRKQHFSRNQILQYRPFEPWRFDPFGIERLSLCCGTLTKPFSLFALRAVPFLLGNGLAIDFGNGIAVTQTFVSFDADEYKGRNDENQKNDLSQTFVIAYKLEHGDFCPLRCDSKTIKKKGERNVRLFQFVAEWTGLEPATPGVTGRYSNQLNYHS